MNKVKKKSLFNPLLTIFMQPRGCNIVASIWGLNLALVFKELYTNCGHCFVGICWQKQFQTGTVNLKELFQLTPQCWKQNFLQLSTRSLSLRQEQRKPSSQIAAAQHRLISLFASHFRVCEVFAVPPSLQSYPLMSPREPPSKGCCLPSCGMLLSFMWELLMFGESNCLVLLTFWTTGILSFTASF